MFLIVGMLVSLALPCTVATAQTNRTVTFTLGSVQGEVGEIISIPLSISAESDVSSFTIYLPIPTNYLEYTTILDNNNREVYWETGEASTEADAMVMASNGIKTLPDSSKGITIACASVDGFWEAGVVISMYFKVIKQIPTSGITLAYNATDVLLIDADSNCTVTTVDGHVTSAAAPVIDQINALPDTITLANESAVVAARNAYAALNDVQKSAITNLNKLQAAETVIANLKDQAQDVVDQINALNVQTLDDEANVIAARNAYNDLSAEQQNLVTNLNKLEAAETKIEELKIEAANKAAAQVVIDQIEALNITSLEDEAEVSAARAAYNNLTDTQKAFVSNLNKLTAAETKLAELKIEAANKAAAQVVINQIAALNVDSLDDNADVQAARTAYNNLTDAQKAYVTNLNKLETAEAKIKDYQFAQGVIDMINALPDNVSLMDEDVVVAAREAYNGLTDTQKGYVTNYPKLLSAEIMIIDLKAAQAVIDQIYGLPFPIALSNEADVIAARNAYNALTDAQKDYVSNLEILVNAENEITRLKALAEQEAADKAAAKVVADQIDALNVQSLDDEADVVAARNAYKALTNAQQAYVTNLAKLQAAEAKIAQLKVEQEEQDAADMAAAKAVVDKIDALNVDSTDDEADVVAARDAYNALTDTQKGLVTNLSKLEDAESDIARLKAEAAAKVEADKAAAKTVSDLINALPANIVLTDESAVNMVRNAYNNLTDDQKNYVTNLDKLTAAEAKIAELKAQADQEAADKAAAKAVDDKIAAIGTVTLSSESAITAARSAYAALTDVQKAYVSKLDVLEAAEETLAQLKAQAEQEVADKAAAKQVDDIIDPLDVKSLDDEPAVVAARKAYDALPDNRKGYVTKLQKLEAAEAKIAELKAQAEQEAADKAAAKVVDDLIAALNVQSLDDKPAVVAARDAYDALTDAQKAYVTNLDKLTAAEEKIAQLEQAAAIIYGDVDGDGKVTATDALEVLKSVVGKVTLDETQFAAADTDGNGKADAADALNILKKVVGKLDKFPVEE